MTPRGAILAAIRSALSGLTAQPEIHTTFADVLRAEVPRSIVIGPGDSEAVEGETHTESGIASVRRYPVRIVCTAWTREDADAMALEVEDALAFGPTADQIGARLTGSAFTESSDKSERVYFSTIVNLDVSYERTTS